MTRVRRRRAATEEKVERILDAAEEVMLEDGYAAVSSRSVAAKVGINASLIHYYFPTLDDLFVAVLVRRAETNVDRMAAVFDSERPLSAWWQLASNPRGTALFIELIAAANHRPALRDAVSDFARDVRRTQMEELTTLLAEYGLDPAEYPPALVATAMQGVAFALVVDQVAGYETATDEARRGMEDLLDRLERRRASRSER